MIASSLSPLSSLIVLHKAVTWFFKASRVGEKLLEASSDDEKYIAVIFQAGGSILLVRVGPNNVANARWDLNRMCKYQVLRLLQSCKNDGNGTISEMQKVSIISWRTEALGCQSWSTCRGNTHFPYSESSCQWHIACGSTSLTKRGLALRVYMRGHLASNHLYLFGHHWTNETALAALTCLESTFTFFDITTCDNA